MRGKALAPVRKKFAKNLHKSIDNKQLYDMFSLFRNILGGKAVQNRGISQ